MDDAIGKTISHYKIIEELGRGGMGVVYKARDTALDRFVALKFLPPHLAASEQDKARFVQEAKSASALNHPNVCTIHAIEEHEGQLFIAMEFIEGQTLRDRKQSYSLKQTIDIAAQIADGLAAAHEHGIVHRDIKPENIMIRKDGIAQIMDFGLAKLRGASRLTKEGSTVGTVGYMSPEQVQGLDSDHRSDIFSLGVLLYEMLTGQSPFKGVHETAIIYEIVNVDAPPMSAVKPDIPPDLDAIVLDCLEKDPRERTQAASQVALELKRFRRESSKSRASRITAAGPAISTKDAPSVFDSYVEKPKLQKYLPWSISAVAFVIAASMTIWTFSRGEKVLPTLQAQILSPHSMYFCSYGVSAGPPVVSPDGRMIAFDAITQDGTTSIYLRILSEAEATPIPGTIGGRYPFWSPDSKSIAFISPDGKLMRVDVVGNPPTVICDAATGLRGSWGKDDIILFSRAKGSLEKVSAAGGKPEFVTTLDSTANEGSHRWPCFLPDGKHYLYFSRKVSYTAEAEADAIMLGSLDGDPSVVLMKSSSNPWYASGHILFMRGDVLLAQPFNENSLTLAGDPIPVAEGIIDDPGFSLGVFSASQNGILTFQTGTGSSGARMVVVNRNGDIQQYVGEVFEYYNPRISPDGNQIVENMFEPRSRTQNLWIYNLARRSSSRLTSGNTTDLYPVWSHNGAKIAYMALSRNGYSVRVRQLVSREPEEVVYEESHWTFPTSWSPDGATLCLTRIADGQFDILLLDLNGQRPVREFFESPFNKAIGMFSPGGRWIAYQSNETGRYEIYIRPYPGPGSAVKVSGSGGKSPTWNPNGRELFYVSEDNNTMSAELVADRSTMQVGSVKALFTRTPVMTSFDVFPDGKHFLVDRSIEPKETDPLTIVVNWTEKLRE